MKVIKEEEKEKEKEKKAKNKLKNDIKIKLKFGRYSSFTIIPMGAVRVLKDHACMVSEIGTKMTNEPITMDCVRFLWLDR